MINEYDLLIGLEVFEEKEKRDLLLAKIRTNYGLDITSDNADTFMKFQRHYMMANKYLRRIDGGKRLSVVQQD